MDIYKYLVIIKNEDKTESVVSYNKKDYLIEIKFKNSKKHIHMHQKILNFSINQKK